MPRFRSPLTLFPALLALAALLAPARAARAAEEGDCRGPFAPTVALRELRKLDVREPSAPGRPAHLAAASGLALVGSRLYVVADDELHLGVFPARGDEPGEFLRLLPGTLPEEHMARKAEKPDFEILIDVGPELLALPSGSRPNRYRGAAIPLAADGSPAPEGVRVFEAERLLGTLLEKLPQLNLEGGVYTADEGVLRLYHRGSMRNPQNFLIELAWRPGDGVPMPEAIRRMVPIELGEEQGVPFGITDATRLPDGRTVVLYAAEATDDPVYDAPVVAAGAALLAEDGATVLRAWRFDPIVKGEGLHAEAVDGGIRILVVTDADDESVPASLLTGFLPLEAPREQR